MRIPIDRDSLTPLYKQIENYLRRAILRRNLEPGTRLPATRTLAEELGVNRMTVESAYAGLQADGLIEARVGSGTYVLPTYTQPGTEADDPDRPWPAWQQNIRADSLAPTRMVSDDQLHPQLIDFSSGVGDVDIFPVNQFRKTVQAVLRRDGIDALEYGDRRGYPPLRHTISQVLARQGLQIKPENILITAGSQQAISFVSHLLLRPGDAVIVENPTYAGALNLFRVHNLKIIPAPIDEDGLEMEALESLLEQHRPRLLYTIPTFHNPTGICMSGQRRRQLIALAEACNLPIMEDDFVGDLRYEGRAQPALKALDPYGNVIYTSTFSKMLMPGLRVGFLVAEGPVYDHLVGYKHVNDLATSNLVQRSLEAFVNVGRYQSHLRRSCQRYRQRRDAMLAAIEAHFPAGIQVDIPKGGLFLWVGLPEGVSASRLLPLAQENGVTFAPGTQFFADPAAGDGFMRLNFVSHPVRVIEAGIRRLGDALQRMPL